MRTRITLLLLLITPFLFSRTLIVSLDGSQNYTRIQSAVDAASNGDTVLVYPGTYYENIVINDKFITLASLNYITGEEQYIHSTILDGNFSGSVIWMELRTAPQPADAVIQGFTIIHGSGYIRHTGWPSYGGGGVCIECADSDYWHDVLISDCQIKYNIADAGAGVAFIYWGNLHMKNVSVHHNYATYGAGGVLICSSGFIHDSAYPCNYYANKGAPGYDVDISEAEFDTIIYADTLTCEDYEQGFIRITPYFNNELPELTVHWQHDMLDVVDHDLYVSPDGDDNNSGLTPNDPLKTIWYANYLIASNPNNPRTIHLAPGVYRDREGDQRFGIGLMDHVRIVGSGMDHTFLECSNALRIFHSDYTTDIRVANLSMEMHFPVYQNHMVWSPCHFNTYFTTDCQLENIRASNSELGRIPAIQLWQADTCTLRNIVIENNTAHTDPGISLQGKNFEVDGCTIRNNQSIGDNPDYCAYSAFSFTLSGETHINRMIVMGNVNDNCYEVNCPGRLYHGQGMDDSQLYFTNCLFADNVSQNSHVIYMKPYSGGIHFTNCTFTGNSSTNSVIRYYRTSSLYEVDPLTFTNCAFWDDTDLEVNHISMVRCDISADYSLFRNGIDGIYSPDDEIIWGEGNLDLDPMLTDAEHLYYPQEGSPLINAGTPDTTGLYLPSLDLCKRARVWDGCVDIGCHEYGSVGVAPDPESEDIPAPALALTNYPNPFNPETTISFALPQDEQTAIKVYNLRGQLVKTLVNDRMEAGEHEVVWSGRDDSGKNVSSGVYFLRMQTSGKTISRKLMLIK